MTGVRTKLQLCTAVGSVSDADYQLIARVQGGEGDEGERRVAEWGLFACRDMHAHLPRTQIDMDADTDTDTDGYVHWARSTG